jgi:catechol-2,3-dioxygenase
MTSSIPVRRVNHLVLQVRSLQRSIDFYGELFGFVEAVDRYGPKMAFLRAPGSQNHHDLGLVEIAADAPAANPAAVGMFHFALEVDDVSDLARARDLLAAKGMIDREFDHGATKSVYGLDPVGNSFEIVWVVPRADWGEWETRAPDRLPLDLEADVLAWG